MAGRRRDATPATRGIHFLNADGQALRAFDGDVALLFSPFLIPDYVADVTRNFT